MAVFVYFNSGDNWQQESTLLLGKPVATKYVLICTRYLHSYSSIYKYTSHVCKILRFYSMSDHGGALFGLNLNTLMSYIKQ